MTETQETKPLPVDAKFNEVILRASWTPPCVGPEPECGSPAVYYTLQLMYAANGDTTDWFSYASAIEDTFTTVQVPLFTYVSARVSGFDDQDRQGMWSEPSEWYYGDFGPPAPPGVVGWLGIPTSKP